MGRWDARGGKRSYTNEYEEVRYASVEQMESHLFSLSVDVDQKGHQSGGGSCSGREMPSIGIPRTTASIPVFQ